MQGLDETPFTYIDTEEQLRAMVDKLEDAKEIAVDLEHHSYRTFQGLTCLMQLSDRHEDFVIDVLKLRHLMGPLLAPIFADPQVDYKPSCSMHSALQGDSTVVRSFASF